MEDSRPESFCMFSDFAGVSNGLSEALGSSPGYDGGLS